MTTPRRLELLMQRAADGELTPAQRHELMEAAETQPDGWKQLACTFLEDQLVGQTFRRGSVAAAEPEESVVTPLKTRKGFWYQHPALTTAVTICLAFTLGLTVPWDRVGQSNQGTPIAMPVPADPNLVGSNIPVDGDVHQQLREKVVEMSHLLEVLAQPRPGEERTHR